METSDFKDKEPKQIFIDNAVPADAEEIVNIMNDTWLEVYPSPENGVSKEWVYKTASTFNVNYLLENFNKDDGDQNKIFIVAKDKNAEIIGLLRGIKYPDSTELRSCYLRVNSIGTGTGGSLMEYFLKWADNTKPIKLDVASYNNRAIGFYEHYGFKKTAEPIEKFLGVMPQTRMIRDK